MKLVTTATSGGSIFFQAGVLYSIEILICWPILAKFGWWCTKIDKYQVCFTSLYLSNQLECKNPEVQIRKGIGAVYIHEGV